jgi:hypothetical protein
MASVLTAPALVQAGWPFTNDGGPRRGTREYYEMRAGEPIGERQQYKAGKVWPPDPRPVGDNLPWIHRFHAAHYWPHPYEELDRMSVHTIVDAHIITGWQSACTLHDFHFDPELQTLNSSGRAHLQWILLNVPVAHRQAFVASSVNAQLNANRLAHVETAVASYIGDGHSMPVVLRMATPHGRPASEVDAIFDGRIESMLPPAIEYTSVGTAGP